jgi:hypothetical protein
VLTAVATRLMDMLCLFTNRLQEQDCHQLPFVVCMYSYLHLLIIIIIHLHQLLSLSHWQSTTQLSASQTVNQSASDLTTRLTDQTNTLSMPFFSHSHSLSFIHSFTLFIHLFVIAYGPYNDAGLPTNQPSCNKTSLFSLSLHCSPQLRLSLSLHSP